VNLGSIKNKICIFVVMITKIFAFILLIFLSFGIQAQELNAYIKELTPTHDCQTLTTNFNVEFFPTPVDTLIINYGDGFKDTIPNPTYAQNFSHLYSTVGNYSITATVYKNNISDSDSKIVNVYPLPNASFVYDNYGYPGIQDTFYYSNNRYLFVSQYPNDTTHTWLINEVIQYSNTDSLGYNFKSIGNYSIKHIVNILGCTDSSSQTLEIKEHEIQIPNIFSPNGDGINDVFYIQTDGEMIYTFTVLDRNGNRVFTSESKIISWDGRTYWGELLNPGNYYYSLTPNNGETQTGVIYLAR